MIRLWPHKEEILTRGWAIALGVGLGTLIEHALANWRVWL